MMSRVIKRISKRIMCLILVCFLSFSFTGCWSYRGLDTITIVSGMAIDMDESGENYKLTFETVDLSKPIKQTGLKSKIIESQGRTILDAIRNARKIPTGKLYFGNMPIVIVSKEIAEAGGVEDIISWLLRDVEPRETIRIIVSKKKTAGEIFTLSKKNESVLSYDILNTIQSDHMITASTIDMQIFQAYNAMNGEGIPLMLPAICCRESNGTLSPEIDGIAVFKDKKLVNFLTPTEARYYLIVMGKIKGGVLTFDIDGDGKFDTLYEITDNKTKNSFEYKDGQLKLKICHDIHVTLSELTLKDLDVMNTEQVKNFTNVTQQLIEQSITDLVKKSQTIYQTDIFGIGSMVYKKKPKLWKELKPNWEEVYKNMEVEVETKVELLSTASIKNERPKTFEN